ncbi:hypothetical protein ZWY2020_037366 [Hordeum vulgare]|nr:hypothetical protein ZWY2020_037366 [Hordeum vulgare]
MARSWSCMALLVLALSAQLGASDLTTGYYNSSCPNLESIVHGVVTQKMDDTIRTIGSTIRTIGSTIRLFFHDSFVEGCDASVLIRSTPGNPTEMDADDNKSLAFEGYETVRIAKEAVEAAWPNLVSCADILTIATRDAIALSGGPFYPVELGRLDGLSSTASCRRPPAPSTRWSPCSERTGSPCPTSSPSQFMAGGRAAAHTVGLAHCGKFRDRVYGSPADATLNPKYAAFLRTKCPADGSSDPMVLMDQATPALFDNQENLKNILMSVYRNKDAVDDELVEIVREPADTEGANN